MNEKLALRPREVCELLGVSPRTLWAWTKEGRIPHVRIGRTLRYPVEELRSWLRQQTNYESNSEGVNDA